MEDKRADKNCPQGDSSAGSEGTNSGPGARSRLSGKGLRTPAPEAPLADDAAAGRFESRHKANFKRLKEIYGGPLGLLPREEALGTVRKVNQAIRGEPFRAPDSSGNPGGLVELPASITPIIVGDLHAQVNNLLTLLMNNSFLENIDRGEAALIFLGDAVHREAQSELGEMDSSLLIMDLIFKLKLHFPERVFFIIGNHDSFSPDLTKGGVPQSLLWEREVRDSRGDAYRKEMSLFYRHAPLVVAGPDFVACHAGPPRTPVTREMLVEVRQFPELVHELTWTRVQSDRWPQGYTGEDADRFRKTLGLADDAPFLVGHYPQDGEDTLWLDVNGIPGHHIVYSARTDRIAVFTRINETMVPQIYPVEPLLEIMGAAEGLSDP